MLSKTGVKTLVGKYVFSLLVVFHSICLLIDRDFQLHNTKVRIKMHLVTQYISIVNEIIIKTLEKNRFVHKKKLKTGEESRYTIFQTKLLRNGTVTRPSPRGGEKFPINRNLV